MLNVAESLRLVSRMSGMPEYPRRDEAELALVAEFRRLAPDCKTGEKLVDEFLGWPQCPTVADLRNVPHQVLEQNGPPPAPHRKRSPFGLCNGDGWQVVYALHTHERTPAGGGYVRKQLLAKQQHDALLPKVDWQTQFLYAGVKKCECQR